jgi:predicted Zn-dependent protease
MLGLQYMYKAGYDPTASIDLFERILSLEKRNPGVMARVFNTHPMTADRIVKTQKNIAEMLPNRPEFVVTTSEFNEVRERLKSRYVKRTVGDPKRPSLRKAPAAAEADDSDEKPTLKRRDLVD